jgi:uncharacterized protein (DUF885 family)
MLLRLSAVGLLLILTNVEAADATTPPLSLPPADSPKLAALAQTFVRESLALSPISASAAGYHKHKDKTGHELELDAMLDDVSPQGYAEQLEFYKAWQGRFAKEVPASPRNAQDAADLELLQDQLALNLLELETIQNYKHNPTVFVEAIGNALFLPMTQEYASKDVRTGHVLARMAGIPRFCEQARHVLSDADPIFIKVAVEENDGNVDLVETVKADLPEGSALRKRYDAVAPRAVAALKELSGWLTKDLALRKTERTWRLGKAWYAEKFKHVMETPVTPEQVLADAEKQMKDVRAEMLELATPLHAQWFAEHGRHDDQGGRDRENTIIGEVLNRIADEHPERDHLMDSVKADLDGIRAFIREHKLVSLNTRDNLKVIATPLFMRGIYSVAGFHNAPPLEPTAEAQYWVTPIDAKVPEERALSKLREYNNWTLKWLSIHEALPGHYIQFEHANNVEPEHRRLLRSLFGNGAYVEGWAEYMAQVMLDQGFADNSPKFRMMMRKVRLRLLANTILDVRMQTLNMSDAEALDLMIKDGFQTQAEAEGKLQRAKLSSTQLPTYFVGLRGWLALRQKYERTMGEHFDMMKFHDLVLDQGAVPIDALEKIVLP